VLLVPSTQISLGMATEPMSDPAVSTDDVKAWVYGSQAR